MPIHLTPKLQTQVDQLIQSGTYSDAESVLGDSLALLVERQRKLEWLRNELQAGEEEDLRGETIEYTLQTLSLLLSEARERARLGHAVGDAVKPPD